MEGDFSIYKMHVDAFRGPKRRARHAKLLAFKAMVRRRRAAIKTTSVLLAIGAAGLLPASKLFA